MPNILIISVYKKNILVISLSVSILLNKAVLAVNKSFIRHIVHRDILCSQYVKMNISSFFII